MRGQLFLLSDVITYLMPHAISGLLKSEVGVPPPTPLPSFFPEYEGYPPGFFCPHCQHSDFLDLPLLFSFALLRRRFFLPKGTTFFFFLSSPSLDSRCPPLCLFLGSLDKTWIMSHFFFPGFRKFLSEVACFFPLFLFPPFAIQLFS